ncbi:pyridoxine 5'-phosphate synthase [Actimicrobium sp. CCC2.4]|uniref:pyridoxine 5'-phosphate synthase n=1 Tax=Actimicrobium sp. CCC2.4 TaxID=3048606 RepID=UPI002AC9265C|nr:pyridoxine 5'-phosphate synthase [Actimicrobium sp. CCC2.4]MEB0135560.1 pyridoxine 5'-phosphate synthase [Actimicrobium sp. CCC2.4]WPX33873.1 pyridoxine 5'-phosphate synthase [Actimicrobium sp. CCC2.4]
MSYLNPHSTGSEFCVDLMPLVRFRTDRPGPDLVQAATAAQSAGADAISLVAGEIAPGLLTAIASALMIRLHLHLPAGGASLAEAISVRPHRICLAIVDVSAAIAQQLQAHGIELALAIDSSIEQVQAAHAAGACAIELDASKLGTAEIANVDGEFARLVACAAVATRLGMQVQIAHGIDLTNAGRLAVLGDVVQIQVGQALLVRAIVVGWQLAVGEMKAVLTQAGRQAQP